MFDLVRPLRESAGDLATIGRAIRATAIRARDSFRRPSPVGNVEPRSRSPERPCGCQDDEADLADLADLTDEQRAHVRRWQT